MTTSSITSSIDKPDVEKNSFQTDQVLTIAGAHLVHDTFGAFLNPLLPLIIDKLSISLTLAGSLTLFYRLPSIINPFIGLLADRIDLRMLVILAPTVTAVAMSLLGVAPSYGVLILLLLAAGFGSGAIHVTGPVIVNRVSGGKVGTGMSVWMVAGELARTIGPILATAVAGWLTLEGYYPVMLLGIVTSLVLFFRLRGVDIKPDAATVSLPLKEAWLVLRSMLIPLALVLLVQSFMKAALTVFLPVYFTSSGQTVYFAGRMLAMVEFAGAIGVLITGTLSDRLERRMVLLGTTIIAPIFMLLFFMFENNGSVLPYIFLALTGFTALSSTPVIMAMVQEHGNKLPATANGFYMGISFVISAGGSPLVGWIGDNFGLHYAFVGSAIVALLSAPLILLLPKSKMSSRGRFHNLHQ
jgi:FSR family fosmidomycin resistance protein-like MFS transporter